MSDRLDNRKGRIIAMSDEVDALIDELARRESRRRGRRVTRADLVEEWARRRTPRDWTWPTDAPAEAELAAA